MGNFGGAFRQFPELWLYAGSYGMGLDSRLTLLSVAPSTFISLEIMTFLL